MPNVEFANWAVVAYHDETGLGRQAAMFAKMLGLGRHIYIPSERLADNPETPGFHVKLPTDADDDAIRKALQGLQGIMAMERPDWHPRLARIARDMGIKTVCVPNWEWFRPNEPLWNAYDLLVGCSEMTYRVVSRLASVPCVRLTLPLDISPLPVRKVSGPARLFVHNAGLVDADDRKGTADTILAFKKVANPDIRLLVRMQKEAPMPNGDPRIQVQVGNLENYSDLYETGDVMVQPSKMEGLGLMVLEPLCCGLPVITTDYPPMSEHIADSRLRAKPRIGRRKAFATQWVKHAHLRIPQTGDLARKIAWCAENDLAEISAANRKIAEERYDPARILQEWTEALGRIA